MTTCQCGGVCPLRNKRGRQRPPYPYGRRDGRVLFREEYEWDKWHREQYDDPKVWVDRTDLKWIIPLLLFLVYLIAKEVVA